MLRKFSVLCAVACFPSLTTAAEGIIWAEETVTIRLPANTVYMLLR